MRKLEKAESRRRWGEMRDIWNTSGHQPIDQYDVVVHRVRKRLAAGEVLSGEAAGIYFVFIPAFYRD